MDISLLRDRGEKQTYTVTELNDYIKNIFDSDRTLRAISVKGEISNFTNHRSGHLYFTLKDESSQIKSVMFRSAAQKLRFAPENGMKVIVFGYVSVYQRDGVFQMYASTMQPDGIGALYLAYEQLKEKLAAEGLFDAAFKRDIPEYPENIGVITSPTGAAVRDIINVTKRRFPLAKIYLYPSLVQGDGAEENLIKALDYFEKTHLVDVIIIGRGGGSIEDLWSFNGEGLARKIFSIDIPVISAVGHETDFTICDFVSDLRAPTPSAAAELSVPDINNIFLRLDDISERINYVLLEYIEKKRETLKLLSASRIFASYKTYFENHKEKISRLAVELTRAVKSTIEAKRGSLIINAEKTNALNPLSVISRGYAMVQKNEDVIKSVTEIISDDLITIRFSDGVADVRVVEIKKGEGIY